VGQPMLLVTGTPVVTSSLFGLGQEVAIALGGAFGWDFETWRGNPETLLGLYELLREARPSLCTFVSGDVHFGSCFEGELSWAEGIRVRLGQLTSSALKNRIPSDLVVDLGEALAGGGFPPDLVMGLGEALVGGGERPARWLYDGDFADGPGTPVGRVLMGGLLDSETQLLTSRHFRRTYCEERWQLAGTLPGGYFLDNNFGWLTASASDLRARLHDAAGGPLGEPVTLPCARISAGRHSVPSDSAHASVPHSPGEVRQFSLLTRDEMWRAHRFATLCVDAARSIETSSPVDGWTVVTEDIQNNGSVIVPLRSLNDLDSGFSARVYFHEASQTYALCFKGSEPTWQDWYSTNVIQAIGRYSAQYDRAMSLGERFAQIRGRRLVIVGYSLGGGLASAASSVSGLEAFTFNSAGLHAATLTTHEDYALLVPRQRAINAFYLDGEILSALQDGGEHFPSWHLPPAPGQRIVLPTVLTGDPRRHDTSPLAVISLVEMRASLHMLQPIISGIESALRSRAPERRVDAVQP
jgi:hypothetical protein